METSTPPQPSLSHPPGPRPRALRASAAVASALRKLITERGEAAAIAHVGLARSTISRLVAEMSVQPSTLIAAAAALGVSLVGTIADPEIEG